MSTLEQARAEALTEAQAQLELDDRARAERAAAVRRRRASLHNFIIRMVSLAIFLTLWQIAGLSVDPVLFTTPAKVAVAAVDMVWSGELWFALWPSLIVLLRGSRSPSCSERCSAWCWHASTSSTSG